MIEETGMFKVEDKVKHDLWGEGRVSFGPFHVPDHSGQCYLVENSEGKHFIGSETLLSAVPRFEVDQVVRAKYLTSGLAKVAAGPFKGEKYLFYVLELPEGRHSIEVEEDITPVEE